MAFSINTNISALQNQKELAKSEKSVGQAFERLTSGKRINRAADDASGLQMVEAQRADIQAYTAAMRNINDGASMLNIADSTMETGSGILTRMSELATQAANGTLSNEQRQALDDEYQALKAELDRTQETAQFNGQSVTGETVIQSGIDSSANSQTTLNVTAVDSTSVGVAGTNLLSQEGAKNALTQTTAALDTVSSSRAEIGAAQSSLETSFSNISSQRLLTTQAMSTKADADIAEESANLSAASIKQQMNVSLAAHANLSQEQVLRLLS